MPCFGARWSGRNELAWMGRVPWMTSNILCCWSLGIISIIFTKVFLSVCKNFLAVFYSILFTLHPGKLTWNLKIACCKRKIIFQTSTIGSHVNFQGCIIKMKLSIDFCSPQPRYDRPCPRSYSAVPAPGDMVLVPVMQLRYLGSRGRIQPWQLVSCGCCTMNVVGSLLFDSNYIRLNSD